VARLNICSTRDDTGAFSGNQRLETKGRKPKERHYAMAMIGYAFLTALIALSALWVFAISISIKALRLADPALYRAAASELAGHRHAGSNKPDTPLWPMRRWMRRQRHHRDDNKHKAVRRWMHVHHGAQSALVVLFGFGLVMFFLE